MAKTILITGQVRVLGAGMAREFAAKGYNLVCARRLERLKHSNRSYKASFRFRWD